MLIGMGASYYSFRRLGVSYAYRSMWPAIVDGAQSFGMLIMVVLIVLLTASEKTWRTERQNVIDGLSRTQYFASKVLMLVGCTLLMWATIVVLGGIFEVLNRSLVDGVDSAFMTGSHVRQLAVVLLYLFFVGTIALMFGTVASSSGAALALAFLFLMLQAPLIMIMARQGGMWHELTAWMPMNVLQALTSEVAWNAEQYAQEMAQGRERGFPLILPGSMAALAAAGYSALMCAASFWSIRMRDL
jgi:ABC-type transport system involved in multi-copper enzyme maturation permease subunit